ncbi:MAG TPA: type II secretion system protein GspG [Gemmataceae bacterium]|nr:type II secretion system protein GspG [Gemmataceae bacterium]
MLARNLDKSSARAARRAAFTLMEVLVVMAILVILASVGGVAVFKYLEVSKEKAAKLQIKTIENAVEAYYTDTGDYPQSLQALLQPDENGRTYLEQKDLTDPWGKPYQYNPQNLSNSGKPIISTTNRNGQPIANYGQSVR